MFPPRAIAILNPTVSGAWLASATSCVSDARCSALIDSSAGATRGNNANPVARPITCERFTARCSVSAQLAKSNFERLHHVRAGRIFGRIRIAAFDRTKNGRMSFEGHLGLRIGVHASDAIVEIELTVAPNQIEKTRIVRGFDDRVVKTIVNVDDMLARRTHEFLDVGFMKRTDGFDLALRRTHCSQPRRVAFQRGARFVDLTNLFGGVFTYD